MNPSFLVGFLFVACLEMMQIQIRADDSTLGSRYEQPQVEDLTDVRQGLKKRCEPGQQFQLDCNSCTCTEEGNDFLCGGRNCPGSNISPSDLVCAPGFAFHDDCNICVCNARGSDYLCTKKNCIGGVGGSLSGDGGALTIGDGGALTGDGGTLTNGDGGALTNGDGGALTGDGGAVTKVCSPGQAMRVQCNTCFCNRAGTELACSRRVCRNAPYQGDGGALSGDGGALTPIGNDKLCTRKDCTHNFNDGGDDGALTGDGGALTGDGGALTGDGGALTGDGGALTGDGGALTGDGGVLTGDGGALTGDGGALTGDGGALTNPSSKKCRPLKMFMEGCNICTCNLLGTRYTCTNRNCNG